MNGDGLAALSRPHQKATDLRHKKRSTLQATTRLCTMSLPVSIWKTGSDERTPFSNFRTITLRRTSKWDLAGLAAAFIQHAKRRRSI